jgi:hypothetical protein
VADRVAAFEAVAGLVGTPVAAPTDDERERAIAAALASATVAPATVVPMRRRAQAPRWLPAAAAVAVVVGGLGLLLAALGSAGDDADEDTAASEAPTEATAFQSEALEESSGAGGPATTAAVPAGGAAADSAAPAATVPDLGDLPDVAALEAALRAPATTTTGAAGTGGGNESAGEGEDDALFRSAAPCADGFGSSLVQVLTARLAGQPVTVAVFEDPDGDRSYTVVDQATCAFVTGDDL